jgi:hypothetical protein
MKLTQTMRDAFVRAALADVPKVDYDSQIRAEALRIAVAKMPPAVQAFYKKHPDWVTRYTYAFVVPGCALVSVLLPMQDGAKLDPGERKRVDELLRLNQMQIDTRKALMQKLHSVASGASTRKQLLDALPEFAKYLPADAASASRTVPALANVVADFVQAGWKPPVVNAEAAEVAA